VNLLKSKNNGNLIESTVKYERRYDIDWLRIIAVFLVFIYHCSRFFDETIGTSRNKFLFGMSLKKKKID